MANEFPKEEIVFFEGIGTTIQARSVVMVTNRTKTPATGGGCGSKPKKRPQGGLSSVAVVL